MIAQWWFWCNRFRFIYYFHIHFGNKMIFNNTIQRLLYTVMFTPFYRTHSDQCAKRTQIERYEKKKALL